MSPYRQSDRPDEDPELDVEWERERPDIPRRPWLDWICWLRGHHWYVWTCNWYHPSVVKLWPLAGTSAVCTLCGQDWNGRQKGQKKATWLFVG
jgi:hypothetical protein